MEESVVHKHEDHTCQEAGEDDAKRRNGEGVSASWNPVKVPKGAERSVLQQDDQVIDEKTTARAALLDVEPTEDVDDANNHVEDDLFPFCDAELSLAVHDPEGHDAPVQYDEDAEI